MKNIFVMLIGAAATMGIAIENRPRKRHLSVETRQNFPQLRLRDANTRN